MGIQRPLKGAHPSLFGLCLWWPNVWMDQDATWYEGRPRRRPHCVRWGLRPTTRPKKGHSPNFGRLLLWPNGRPSELLLSSSVVISAYTNCSSDSFQCGIGLCIDSSKVCDETWDCRDGSDEAAKTCGELNTTNHTALIGRHSLARIPN